MELTKVADSASTAFDVGGLEQLGRLAGDQENDQGPPADGGLGLSLFSRGNTPSPEANVPAKTSVLKESVSSSLFQASAFRTTVSCVGLTLGMREPMHV